MGSGPMGFLVQGCSPSVTSNRITSPKSHWVTAQTGDLGSIHTAGKKKNKRSSGQHVSYLQEVVTIPSHYQRYSAGAAAICLMRFGIGMMSFLVIAIGTAAAVCQMDRGSAHMLPAGEQLQCSVEFGTYCWKLLGSCCAPALV